MDARVVVFQAAKSLHPPSDVGRASGGEPNRHRVCVPWFLDLARVSAGSRNQLARRSRLSTHGIRRSTTGTSAHTSFRLKLGFKHTRGTQEVMFVIMFSFFRLATYTSTQYESVHGSRLSYNSDSIHPSDSSSFSFLPPNQDPRNSSYSMFIQRYVCVWG